MDKLSLFEVEGADFDQPPWNCIVGKMFFPDDAVRHREFLGAIKAEEFRKTFLDTGGGAGVNLPADWFSRLLEGCLKWRALEEEAIEPLA